MGSYSYLEALFVTAETEAKFSPCVRRQYAAMTFLDEEKFVVKNNSRVTKACGKGGCIRQQQGITNGHHTRTELGAEIHAEQAVLLSTSNYTDTHIILVGFIGEVQLLDEDSYPCLACAKMIKYAGYKNVYMRDLNREIKPYSIEAIIEYQEEVLTINE